MNEERQQAEIRATSTFKIYTGVSSLDYTYPKGAPIDAVFKDIAHAVVFNKGKTEAKKFFDEFLAGYEGKWRDV
jgi:hypothetical protein